LAPRVDVIRKQDAAQLLLQRISMTQVLLLTTKVVRNKDAFKGAHILSGFERLFVKDFH
jgi:hypothetical protein